MFPRGLITFHYGSWGVWGVSIPVKPPRLVDVSVKKPLIKVHTSGSAGGADSFLPEGAAGTACGAVFLARPPQPLVVLPSFRGSATAMQTSRRRVTDGLS